MRRRLNEHEIVLGRQVFQRTLPYRAIGVSDALGLGGRPYTLNYMALEDDDTYVLHVGPGGFSGMHLSPYWRQTLVHELTHVWQSRNSAWPASYIFKSIGCQIARGDNAYAYQPGQAWDSYNVEEQASIVEDWFAQGQPVTGTLYPYIRDNVRAGKPAK